MLELVLLIVKSKKAEAVNLVGPKKIMTDSEPILLLVENIPFELSTQIIQFNNACNSKSGL